MLDRASERWHAGNDASDTRRRAVLVGSLGVRIVGSLIGLASLLLPWGSIVIRDDAFATVSVTGVGMADLLTSSHIVIAVASISFIAATALVLIDGRAVIGQIVALAALFITIPGLLAERAAALPPVSPIWSVSTPIALGFYLGLLSAVVLLLPFLPGRREARRESQTIPIGSQGRRPEETYHGWGWWKGPFT